MRNNQAEIWYNGYTEDERDLYVPRPWDSEEEKFYGEYHNERLWYREAYYRMVASFNGDF